MENFCGFLAYAVHTHQSVFGRAKNGYGIAEIFEQTPDTDRAYFR
jgi:hypothetical protein